MRNYREALLKEGVPKSTVAKFVAYHSANPHIWQEFEKRALNAIHSGENRLFAKAIMEDIRRDPKVNKQGEYKVSNSMTAYYARSFIIKYPHHRNKFVLKTIKGITKVSGTGQGRLF